MGRYRVSKLSFPAIDVKGLSGGRTLLEENTPVLTRVVTGDLKVCGLAKLWCQDAELLLFKL